MPYEYTKTLTLKIGKGLIPMNLNMNITIRSLDDIVIENLLKFVLSVVINIKDSVFIKITLQF